jgi:diguanylate cyclase (GGDEF)-like protein
MTNTLPNILILEQDKSAIDEFSTIIDHRYHLLIAEDSESAIQMAKQKPIDIALIDIKFPESKIYTTLKGLKLHFHHDEIPIIFTMEKISKRFISKAYELGGVDYIKKPFIPIEVVNKIDRELKILALLKELRFTYKKIEELSQIDPLTNLYNKEFFLKIAHNILKLSRREVQALSILLISIKNLKEINDKFGYEFGNKILKEVAKILNLRKRESDIVARYGTGKFAFLLPHTSIEGAKRVAIKLKETLSKIKIENLEVELDIKIGVSGVNLSLDSNDTVELALLRAEDNIKEISTLQL